jgi:hypothetical protein
MRTHTHALVPVPCRIGRVALPRVGIPHCARCGLSVSLPRPSVACPIGRSVGRSHSAIRSPSRTAQPVSPTR